jgi:hypothetical protein
MNPFNNKRVIKHVAGTLLASFIPVVLHDPEKVHPDEPLQNVIFPDHSRVTAAPEVSSVAQPVDLAEMAQAIKEMDKG